MAERWYEGRWLRKNFASGENLVSMEDGRVVSALGELPFVPSRSGALKRPCELFHPKVVEAAELLDEGDAYPAGAFAEAGTSPSHLSAARE